VNPAVASKQATAMKPSAAKNANSAWSPRLHSALLFATASKRIGANNYSSSAGFRRSEPELQDPAPMIVQALERVRILKCESVLVYLAEIFATLRCAHVLAILLQRAQIKSWLG
jgi:hypothetical protein